MNLAEALQGISPYRFYRISGMRYNSLSQVGHDTLTFKELSPQLQRGILELIFGIYRVQKMVYDYDLAFVTYCMKRAGIKLKEFFACCEINKHFHTTLRLGPDGDKRLMRIRLELLRLINRLFSYVFA